MGAEISKAHLGRRVAAWVLDSMLVMMLAVGAMFGLMSLLNQQSYFDTYMTACEKYIAEYNIPAEMTQEDYDNMTQAERESYEAAVLQADEALKADEEAMAAFGMYVQTSLLSISLGILAAVVITEFAVPLLLKNGQTLGKKAFSIGVVRTDGVKAGVWQLLVRALLGKYTIETMVPVFLMLMLAVGIMDITGAVVIIGLALLEVVVCFTSKTNGMIHDLLAGTVAVDLNTQRVFATTDDLIAHVKRIQADRAARQDY